MPCAFDIDAAPYHAVDGKYLIPTLQAVKQHGNQGVAYFSTLPTLIENVAQ